jgi:outer membrane protein OmpA-like peptidoglycan-associated protein
VSAKVGVRALEEVRLETEHGAASMEEVLPLSNGIAEGSVLVMDKIYYEYNKATLNYSAIQNIEGLLKIMRGYPDMEVDLVVHADPRGEASLNQALTDERAVNMKKYVVFRGISESKINAFGMGEREPLNRCGDGMDCPEEEFRKNSRIEVRIRKLGPRP